MGVCLVWYGVVVVLVICELVVVMMVMAMAVVMVMAAVVMTAKCRCCVNGGCAMTSRSPRQEAARPLLPHHHHLTSMHTTRPHTILFFTTHHSYHTPFHNAPQMPPQFNHRNVSARTLRTFSTLVFRILQTFKRISISFKRSMRDTWFVFKEYWAGIDKSLESYILCPTGPLKD